MSSQLTISGHVIDIAAKKIQPAHVHIAHGKIERIEATDEQVPAQYILPGFIDAHVHIESSMLTPAGFARVAVVHGTVATVSDPHEIANVLGKKGVEYMLEDAENVPFKFFFGAPSCVPATTFETAGAEIGVDDVESLLQMDNIKYLAEMMNFPGVLHGDEGVLQKIALAKKYNKPVDGHAPGLMGEDAGKYIAAGISTDHECFTAEEALNKLNRGMKILIREGSAAKNFEALIGLMTEHYEHMMFCSDDKHPDSLVEGHINLLVKRALAKGHDLFSVLQMACINPVEHYGLEVGLLRNSDPADFIVVDNLEDLTVLSTYINGEQVAHKGKTAIPYIESRIVNHFDTKTKKREDFQVQASGDTLHVIEALDGQLITHHLSQKPKREGTVLVSDVANDILKITVVNRYADTPPATAFIKNFGLKEGAIASSVGHDSHNIIAVGVEDDAICKVVNTLIAHKGGIAAISSQEEKVIPLPIGGIMTPVEGYQVAEAYTAIDKMVKSMGSQLGSPFMTLSFMALLVIPELKLSDKGLFDGKNFGFIPLVS